MALITNKNSANRVLVVDDQAITRELLSKAISSRGLTVDSASNGEEALALWQSEHHSLVITDCNMPIKDGYALSQDIRQLEQAKHLNHTAIIAWSADAKKEDKAKCFDAGMDSFLKKPINFEQLDQLLLNFTQAAAEKVAPSNKVVKDKPSPIDFDILNQIVPDPVKQLQVLNDLLTYLNKDYASLQGYAKAQQSNKLKEEAHRLKGACKMVGANNIASILAVIENNVSNLGLLDTEILLNKLKESIKQLALFLKHTEMPTDVDLTN